MSGGRGDWTFRAEIKAEVADAEFQFAIMETEG